MATDKPTIHPARTAARVVIAAILLAGFLIAVRALKKSGLFEQALQWVDSLGVWGPLVFGVLFIVAVLLMVPASVFTIGAGMLWGVARGSVYVFLSAMIAGTLCFIIARHFARDWVARRLHRFPAFLALDDAVARDGWKIVAMIRFAPVFPFSLTSYGFGLTRVPLWQYVLATVAIIPGATWYVYLGTVLGDLAGLRQQTPLPLPAKIVIGGIVLIVIVYVTRYVRRALRQKLQLSEPK